MKLSEMFLDSRDEYDFIHLNEYMAFAGKHIWLMLNQLIEKGCVEL